MTLERSGKKSFMKFERGVSNKCDLIHVGTEQTAVASLNRNSICPETSLHRIVSSVCESCSIPKARWRSRRVVTQLARPLLSTGQNNYVLEWKPSLQGRDGPRNGCKRYLKRHLAQILKCQILQYPAQICPQWKYLILK